MIKVDSFKMDIMYKMSDWNKHKMQHLETLDMKVNTDLDQTIKIPDSHKASSSNLHSSIESYLLPVPLP